jgi:hypothetical protein
VSDLWGDIEARLATHSPERDRKIAAEILEALQPQQRDFVLDKSLRKRALCGRRAGKTYTVASYIVWLALTRPRCNILYIAQTRGVARKLLWDSNDTGLKKIAEDFGVQFSFNATNLEAVLPNRSRITLLGADSDEEIEKNRGQSYDLVVIDEAGTLPARRINLLVSSILEPALRDRLGTLCMIGTPAYVLAGPFFEATTLENKSPGAPKVRPWNHRIRWGKQPYSWSFHRWTVKENTALPHLWDLCLQEKAEKGWPDSHPVWQRETLALWVVDGSRLMYRFNEAVNTWAPEAGEEFNRFGLPREHEWVFLLGIDFGYVEDTAITVGAYSSTCPNMYQVYEYSEPRMTTAAIAAKLDELDDMFGEFQAEVGDSAGKQIIETLNQEHGRAILPADKANKRDAIELLSSDLVAQRVFLLKGSKLADQMSILVWDEKNQLREAKGQDDHLADAFLYMHRYAQHHFWSTPEKQAERYSEEWIRQQTRASIERLEREYAAREGDDLLAREELELDKDDWINSLGAFGAILRGE